MTCQLSHIIIMTTINIIVDHIMMFEDYGANYIDMRENVGR
jgi:hypothetical protein